MTRIDGYLSRKAQNVWPAAVVSAAPLADGVENGMIVKERFILDPHDGTQPVELGATFNDAHTALLALMKSVRIQKGKHE